MADRRCRACAEVKSEDCFSTYRSGIRVARRFVCRRCRLDRDAAKKRTRPVKVRDALKDRAVWLRRKYGLTPEAWEAKLVSQERKCGCCQEPLSENLKAVHVDHDHETGAVRDILCRGCNMGIGAFQEQETRLLRAIEYLKRHRA